MVILFESNSSFTLEPDIVLGGVSFSVMSDSKPAAGADWTQLLTDPDLIGHLGKLLQTYREADPEKRDQALLQAMREVKGSKATGAAAAAGKATEAAKSEAVPATPVPTPPQSSPPFEPDIFTPSWGQDRRRYPRMKCFVAVEIRMEKAEAPIWGNLSNTSLGGCLVETSSIVNEGKKIEIGLWVANGKIWVKGMVLNGVVTGNKPSQGVRIKFSEMESAEREVLRHFLKFVESTTKSYNQDNGYLARMKR